MDEDQSLIALVRRCQQAKTSEEYNAAAWALFKRAEPNFHLFLLGRCPESDVDDILQDAWDGIFRRLDAFEGDSDKKVWGWFYTILRRKAIDHRRRNGRNPAAPWMDPQPLMATMAFDDPLPSATASRFERTLEWLNTCGPMSAEMVWLRYMLDLTYEEIGTLLGRSSDAVRMQIGRVFEKTRKLMPEGD